MWTADHPQVCEWMLEPTVFSGVAEALEMQSLSPSPDGIWKSRVQWGPRP